ncbi:serine/threonine-protein kinase [Methanoregula sp.]|uniref:serine/threonine-protein kinase n=1 Tax=Methanoregula sp. TaxID=2052170 RepID=UPI003562479C
MDPNYTSTVKYRKCPSCGTDVLSTMQFCVNCGTKMATRTCPHCNEPIQGDPEFCRNCGKTLVPSRKCPKCNIPITGNPEFCRSCGAPLLESRKCPTCGAVISKNAKFCNGCGRVMTQESATPGIDSVLVEKAQQLMKQIPRFGAMPDLPNADVTTYHAAALQKTVTSMEKFLETAAPDLTISISPMVLNLATWHKMEIQITNTGKAHAFFVTLSFSNDFETRRIKPVTVSAGSTEIVEIGILPKTQGNIPIEVTLQYKDGNSRNYTIASEFWIDVRPQSSTPHLFDPEEEIPKTQNRGGTPKTPPVSLSEGPVTMRTLPPEMSAKYADSLFLGKGGFARVFKAKRKDGQYVAVKVPIDLDESTGKSFIAEMQNWTKLSHPNIVKIYDYNIMPFPYFEEELCDSGLDKLKKPMGIAQAAWVVFNICEGLKYAHSLNIIHRDLKPQNILLKNGIPKISDWGLSKIVTDISSITTSSFTPYYAAPEQVTNKTKDQRTDIWQVGIILYELVTGELPFTGESMIDIIASIPTKEPRYPGDINPEAKPIEGIILKCMEKDPAKRYQSVIALQKDLAEFLKIDYKESLRMSVGAKNNRQSAEYCNKLLLANLKSGDLKEAYKYATDLVNYTEGEIRDSVKELSAQIRIRLDNDVDEVPEEIIEAAELIAHKIGMGLTTM